MPAIYNDKDKDDKVNFNKNLRVEDTKLEIFNNIASNLTYEFMIFLKDKGLTLPEPKVRVERLDINPNPITEYYLNPDHEEIYKVELTSDKIKNPISTAFRIDNLLGGDNKLLKSAIIGVLGEYFRGHLISENADSENTNDLNLYLLTQSMVETQVHMAKNLFLLNIYHPTEKVKSLIIAYSDFNEIDLNTRFNRALELTDGLTDLDKLNDSPTTGEINYTSLANSTLNFVINMYEGNQHEIAKEVLKPPYKVIKDVQSYYNRYIRLG